MLNHNSIIADFYDFLLRKGKFVHTCESYCRDGRQFLAFCEQHRLPLTQCEPATLIAFQEQLQGQGSKPNSIRRSVIAVRQLFRYLQIAGIISETPFDEVVIPDRIEIAPKKLKPAKIKEIFATCAQSPMLLKAQRDCALMALLAYEGLKVTEIINLRWTDYLKHNGFSTLKISGTKSRLIQVASQTHQHLYQYKKAFDGFALLEPIPSKFMFVSFRGRDFHKIIPKITRHGLKFMLYETGHMVHLPHLNAELLRHHAMGYLLELGKTQEEIMAHLGLRRVGNLAKHMAPESKGILLHEG